MPAPRRLRVTFTGATRVAAGERGIDSPPGVWLHFAPRAARLDVDRLDDFAPLGPELDVDVVAGIGKVLRLLRAARISAGEEPEALLDRCEEVEHLLERAAGTRLVVEVRPRSRLRFTAWTDSGIERVEDVTDVIEAPDAWLVMRKHGRFPVRVARDQVVRQLTECERWYEVTDIERGPTSYAAMRLPPLTPGQPFLSLLHTNAT